MDVAQILHIGIGWLAAFDQPLFLPTIFGRPIVEDHIRQSQKKPKLITFPTPQFTDALECPSGGTLSYRVDCPSLLHSRRYDGRG